jgi:hypothetical protein
MSLLFPNSNGESDVYNSQILQNLLRTCQHVKVYRGYGRYEIRTLRSNLGMWSNLIPKPSRLLTVLEGFCDHHAICVCVCVTISVHEPLDRFTKSDVNSVPLENIPLRISYISNNNMAVARACEVEATWATLTAWKQTPVVRVMLLYEIKQHGGDGANILFSFRIDGDYS